MQFWWVKCMYHDSVLYRKIMLFVLLESWKYVATWGVKTKYCKAGETVWWKTGNNNKLRIRNLTEVGAHEGSVCGFLHPEARFLRPVSAVRLFWVRVWKSVSPVMYRDQFKRGFGDSRLYDATAISRLAHVPPYLQCAHVWLIATLFENIALI